MPKASTGFIAYPKEPRIVSETIMAAVADSETSALRLKPWEKMSITGLKIDNLVRDHIRAADVVLADITYDNFNVYYEIGFAIARDKPIIPLVNTSIENAARRARELGLFDTIGWLTYTNSDDLLRRLPNWRKEAWAVNYRRNKDHAQPLFVLDTMTKSNYRNYVYSAIAGSHVKSRSLDPYEVPRLSIHYAIQEVSVSSGVIVMLMQPDMINARENNLRAAFIAGLAHGYGIATLMIQFDEGPAPLDYRDFVRNATSRIETERHVSDFCQEVLILNQESSRAARRSTLGIINEIELGASTAEMETQYLVDYFVTTAEYSRATRSEGALVIGRKGSGKSAIAIRAASEASRDVRALVLDLRPAAHNLSDLRESLLSTVGQGLFDHTIASFWQYILLLEMLLAARERALKRARREFSLQERIRRIEQTFNLTEEYLAGDFTSRLQIAIEAVIQMLRRKPAPEEVRQQITNAMYEVVIPQLREELVGLSEFFSDITIFLDDLDKGWPARKLEAYDVRTIRHAIDVLKIIQRDLRRRDIEFKYLLFLRSDVYDELVEHTADRGKDNPIKVDWSDRQQLTHLLKQRVICKFEGAEASEAWDAFNGGSEGPSTTDRLIDTSLYRPRFLIEGAERVLSFAINRGHSKVEEQDVSSAIERMSLYLVSEFSLEMRNVAGTPADIFYGFIGTTGLLTHDEVAKIISQRWPSLDEEFTIDLLIWYGFLGVVGSSEEPVFIYDRAYDFRRLLAERPPQPEDRMYAVNGAFLKGLEQG